MGLYRLLLAYLVVESHVIIEPRTYNFGVVAVISFLLLSGYVMTALIEKYYRHLSAVPAFYADRIVRLVPQLYVYTALMLICAVTLDFRSFWLHTVPGEWDAVRQFMIFPLNFYRTFPGNMLLPQAWSLDLEAMFYAVFPFILIFRMRSWIAAVSGIVYLAAYAGLIDNDLYGFRYLPGTLFMFICGSWIRSADSLRVQRIPAFVCGAAALLLAFTYVDDDVASTNNRSVLLGLIVGIPIVFVLHTIDLRSRLNDFAGNLSYGVFLSHNLVFAGLLRFTTLSMKGPFAVLVVCAIATLLSYLTFRGVEQPLIVWRCKLRDRRLGLSSAANASAVLR